MVGYLDLLRTSTWPGQHSTTCASLSEVVSFFASLLCLDARESIAMLRTSRGGYCNFSRPTRQRAVRALYASLLAVLVAVASASGQSRCPVPSVRSWLSDPLMSRHTRAPWISSIPRNISCAWMDTTAGPREMRSEEELTKSMQNGQHTSDNYIVLFYAGDWCPWSAEFRRTWARVAARFDGMCMVALDASTHSGLNAGYGIHAFPTVLAFLFGSSNGVRYLGDRSEEDFVAWLVSKTRTAPHGSEKADLKLTGAWREWAEAGVRGLPSIDWILVASAAITLVAAILGGSWTVANKERLGQAAEAREHGRRHRRNQFRPHQHGQQHQYLPRVDEEREANEVGNETANANANADADEGGDENIVDHGPQVAGETRDGNESGSDHDVPNRNEHQHIY
jgi:Thioredoxin